MEVLRHEVRGDRQRVARVGGRDPETPIPLDAAQAEFPAHALDGAEAGDEAVGRQLALQPPRRCRSGACARARPEQLDLTAPLSAHAPTALCEASRGSRSWRPPARGTGRATGTPVVAL